MGESRAAVNAGFGLCKFFDVFDEKRVALERPYRENVFDLGGRVTLEVPHNTRPLFFWLIDAEPVGQRFTTIEVLLGLVQLVKRCFRGFPAGDLGAPEEAFRKPLGHCCGAIWSCTAVYRDAAPQTKIVSKGVQGHHCSPVCEVAQAAPGGNPF